ncbi:hypothetical protein GJ496_008117 [Pomphorhynchus laevis]|nr:hypothetical protein GJ496_008117 [Pomphorhynchus laevis]
MNDLHVEVMLENEARFKAQIEDFGEDFISVSFESSDLPSRNVKYEQVFLPVASVKSDNQSFNAGDECEVYTQINKEGPFGWRPIVIKMVRGEFYMFTFKNGDHDVSEADNFRLKSTASHIIPSTIFKFTATVHPPLIECASDINNHRELKKHLSPAKISFDDNTKEITVVTTSTSVLARAKMMMDLHLKFLEAKAGLIKRTKMVQQQLDGISQPRDTKKELNAKHVEEFTVKESLMGLAIGSNGNNINQAKHLPGVLHIEVDENKVFHVYADSKRAAEDARRLLEFDERVLRIPRKKIGRIIGKNGSTMQEMVDRSGVVRVKVEGDQENQGEELEFVTIMLTGTVESITNMTVIVDYFLMHIEEVDNLIAETRRATAEVPVATPSNLNANPHSTNQQKQLRS